MNPQDRKKEIARLLAKAFAPETLGVEDESYLHEGHEGAKDGRGHFRVLIIAEIFEGKTAIERHRMIYRVLDHMMRLDIHAIAIDAWSPDELDR
jgi:BolA protein